jgi:hypothetical protein
MAQPVYVVNNDGDGIAFLPFLPVVWPPLHLIYDLWTVLSAHRLHPVFKLLACGAAVAALFYTVLFAFRYLPKFMSIGLTVAYMAVVYWWYSSKFLTDPIWIGAITIIAAGVGFFGGRGIAREEHRSLFGE